MKPLNRFRIVISLLILVTLFAGFSVKATNAAPAEVTLILGGYSVPREAFADIIPLFQKEWLDKTGQKVTFKESYAGSGAQSRAVVSGFEADIVALSVEKDVTRIVDAKLITHDWQDNTYKGIVTNSNVVLAVRKGNPKGIKDWADLAQPGLEILTPDPATSGGAQWNVLAAYGAVKHGKVNGVKATDEDTLRFLGDVFKNVTALDKDARESFLNFERGVADVALTYENEVIAGLAAGGDYEIVYPSSTILIEAPVAVVDSYVDKHGTREVAEAFVKFLWSSAGQKVFAAHGFRPLDPEVAKDPEIAKQFPELKDVFTIQEFGGWTKVSKDIFGDNGSFTAVLTQVKGK